MEIITNQNLFSKGESNTETSHFLRDIHCHLKGSVINHIILFLNINISGFHEVNIITYSPLNIKISLKNIVANFDHIHANLN